MNNILIIVTILSVSSSVIETYQVKLVYIVPNGIIPRPDWEELLINIEHDLKTFYSNNLGRTFATTTPSNVMIQSSLTVDQIVNYTNSNLSANVWNHAFSTIVNTKPLAYEYFQQKVGFIFITEIDNWVAYGGRGVTSQAGTEVAAYLITRPFNNIYPFDHETGHLFGLSHAAETVNCLKTLNISVEEEYSFMTQPATRPYVENTIAEYEKKMLTNVSYGRECLWTLGERPHPSKYLTVCTNEPNFDNDPLVSLAMVLVSWGICPYVLCPTDFNCDNIVNIDDLAYLIVRWTKFRS